MPSFYFSFLFLLSVWNINVFSQHLTALKQPWEWETRANNGYAEKKVKDPMVMVTLCRSHNGPLALDVSKSKK